MPLLYIMGILIFAILIAIFAVQNAGPVAIKFFFWGVPEIPLVLVIFGTVLCGIVIGFLLGYYSRKNASGTSRLSKSMNRKKPST
ncbi:MAG TPA: LapA family protein [Syntrophomonadaceae bacterium]|nr:LapA family protein [Syntrophomonadaceae bacterium]